MTCYEEVAQATAQNNFSNSIYYFNCKTNMKKFLLHVDKLSSYFLANNIKKNDIYTIYMPNTPQAFAVFYALNKIGAISNIVHPLTPLKALKELMNETKSKGILVLDILAATLISELNSLETKILVARNSDYINDFKKPFFRLFECLTTRSLDRLRNKTFYSKVIRNKKHKLLTSKQRIDENQVATYIHSGGTSGHAKTIMLSNNAILAISRQLKTIHPKEKNKFTPVVLPIFHAYGLAASMHAPLVLGYSEIIFPKFNAKKINRTIRRYDVTTILSVPLMIVKMMKEKGFATRNLRKLHTVYCGGDMVSKTLQNNFNTLVAKYGSKARLFAGYGLTEACGVITVNTPKDYRFGSVGKPLPEVLIEIWDLHDDVLPHGAIGEIVVSGSTIMNGYFRSQTNGLTIKDGRTYVKTGDIGYYDNDGFLYISGRKKNLIKIASYNIFPSEIEEVVLKLPFIDEACAFEKVVGNKSFVKLLISLKDPDGLSESKKIEKIVIYHCQKHLIKYSIPQEVEIVKELPRTKMSKVDLLKISQMYGHPNE